MRCFLKRLMQTLSLVFHFPGNFNDDTIKALSKLKENFNIPH
jgi:hypothetical protein